RTLTSHDAAILLPQSELTAARLHDELAVLNRDNCLTMAKKGHALANRSASQQVADIIWQAL
ncbi:hypothetical protein R0J93_25990, partial [Pseudoalteromonas sp. SIMBA_148]